MKAEKKKHKIIQDNRSMMKSEAQGLKNYLDELQRKKQIWIAQQALVPLKQVSKPTKIPGGSSEPEGDAVLQAGSGAAFYYNFEDEIAARRVANIKRITLEYVANSAWADGPANDKTWVDFAPFAMEAQVESEISNLEFLISSGNPGAIEALARLARAATAKLSSLTLDNLVQLKEVACRRVNWPVLKGSNSLFSDTDAQFNQLAVGADLPFDPEMLPCLRGKAHKDAMRIAVELLCRLNDSRTRKDGVIYWKRTSVATTAEFDAHKLKPFSKESWPEWFAMAWRILLEETDNHPETNLELRRLGEYRKKHSLQEGAQKSLTPATAASNIRDGIRDRLKRAFKQLAR